jgi:hypothetical protein
MRTHVLGGLILLGVVTLSAADDPPEGFQSLFNGKDLAGWKVYGGKMDVWGAADGVLFVQGGGGGWLMTEKEYGDFELRLEYKLPKEGNSGVALRSPREGNPAYSGMEVQLIDDENWKGLQPWQHTGSIYEVAAAAKQANKPLGEWNRMRIVARGGKVMVELNGEKLVETDLNDHKDKAEKHPGITRAAGHIGLQSYNYRVEFRKLLLKPL